MGQAERRLVVGSGIGTGNLRNEFVSLTAGCGSQVEGKLELSVCQRQSGRGEVSTVCLPETVR